MWKNCQEMRSNIKILTGDTFICYDVSKWNSACSMGPTRRSCKSWCMRLVLQEPREALDAGYSKHAARVSVASEMGAWWALDTEGLSSTWHLLWDWKQILWGPELRLAILHWFLNMMLFYTVQLEEIVSNDICPTVCKTNVYVKFTPKCSYQVEFNH